MKLTPYTTSKGVQIGCRYEPPPHTPTPEEISMQSILLGDKQGDIHQTLAIIITAVIVVLLIASAVIKGVA